ncbi:MAG: protein-L-isoaspartate O-methyltransferase [Alphaproteobacteria bacterium]|nr:protein-L-isoaspartate O-methyltransferase [Alphaproteobacteria bacterium]
MRGAMVDSQLRVNGVNEPRIIAAMSAIPRERFVPRDRALVAYVDEDVPVAPGRALMNPMALGRLLVETRIAAGERVLVVGAGTGYASAVIARLGASVVALEEDAALAATARQLLPSVGAEGVEVVEGPLTGGWTAGAPYHVLFIDGAYEELPAALLAQVVDGGRVAGVVVDGGVPRGRVGVVAGGGFGGVPFGDIGAPLLPGFRKPRAFQF